jgi:CRP/FNR family transcriptional regulator, anaerobic regulatory protein
MPLSIRARAMLASGMQAAGIHDLLTDDERDRLLRIAAVVDLPGRHLSVFSQGAEADALYIVSRGAIRICRSLEAGARQILAFMYPGDLLGLAEDGRYVNSAETLAPARLFRIPYASLKDLLEHDTHLQLVLLVKLAHELRAAQRHIVMAARSHVAWRLALLLGDLCLDTTYFNPGTKQLTLPITRRDIGDYLGAAPDVITRAFATLERERLASRLTSRTVVIPDVARLVRYGRSRSRPSSAPG